MSLYVVDASMVIKWYIPEELSDKADAFLARVESSGEGLIAPDFILIELANVLWKKRRANELRDDEVQLVLDELLNHLGVSLIESHLLLAHAVGIAAETDCSAYDSLYLAAAEAYDAVLMTADGKLVSSLSDHTIARRTAFLGSL